MITEHMNRIPKPQHMLLLAATHCVALIMPSPVRAQPAAPSPMRAQVTVENWDKGGAVSHWAYLHVSEVSPTAIIRRGRSIVNLPQQLRPEIGALKLSPPGEPEQTLEQFVNNGAVDGCIVLHAGEIVFERYPTIHPDDLQLAMSVGKAFVATALALLEEGGWAGQLLYINRDKDVVVAYSGTNKTADPKMEPIPCRIIARTFF